MLADYYNTVSNRRILGSSLHFSVKREDQAISFNVNENVEKQEHLTRQFKQILPEVVIF